MNYLIGLIPFAPALVGAADGKAVGVEALIFIFGFLGAPRKSIIRVASTIFASLLSGVPTTKTRSPTTIFEKPYLTGVDPLFVEVIFEAVSMLTVICLPSFV